LLSLHNIIYLRYHSIFLLVIFCINSLYSQSIIELKEEYLIQLKEGNDSIAYTVCKKIAMKCPDPDVKIIYSNYALRIGQNVKNYHWQAVAKTLEANAYISKGKLPNAITLLHESIDLYDS